jgi:hypothetical protein
MFTALAILHHFCQLFQILACLLETDSIMVTLLGAEVKWLLLLSPGNTHFTVTVMFKALSILHHFRQLFQILECLFETDSIMVTLLGAEVKWLW